MTRMVIYGILPAVAAMVVFLVIASPGKPGSCPVSDAGNKKMVAQFAKYPVAEDETFLLPFFNSVLRDKLMHELGIGTMRNMKSIMTGVFYTVWLCRSYTIREKFNIWHSKFSFVNKSGLRTEVLALDMAEEVP